MTTDEQRIFVCENLLGWKWYRHPSANSLRHPHYRFLAHPTIHEIDQSPQWIVAADMTEKPCAIEYMVREFFFPTLTLDWLHECEMKLTGDRKDENSQLAQYQTNLCLVCGDGQEPLNVYDIDLIRATAEQRLAALVETLKGLI